MNFDFIKKNNIYLVLFCGFLIIGFIILTNYFSAKNLEIQVLEEYNIHRDFLLEKSAFDIEKEIYNRETELTLLEKQIKLNEIPIKSCSELLFPNLEQKNIAIENFFIINGKGKIVSCSDSKYFDFLNLNVAETDYYKLVLSSNKNVVKHIKNSQPGQIYILTRVSKTNQTLLSIIEIQNIYSKYIHQLVGNNNYYYLFDKTNNQTIMKSLELENDIVNDFIKKTYKYLGFLEIKNKNFIFNKKQMKIGTEVWEIGVFSSTNKIDKMFLELNNKHLILIFFISIILIILFLIILRISKLKNIAEIKLKKTELTLEQYGIHIDVENGKSFFTSNTNLIDGNIYILKDNKSETNDLFVKSLSNTKIGLGFLKENINNFKKKYNLEKTSFVKLGDKTKEKSTYNIENNVQVIFELIRKFLYRSNELKIVYIDSLDYLILKNGFKKVLTQLYEIKEIVKNSKHIILLSLNQNVLSPRELHALENEFIDIEIEEKNSLEDLSKLELEILEFVNNLNNNKVQVRFKDISLKFAITKPTTRKKISNLEKKGLLSIEDEGRNKLVKITSKGRNFL